MKTKPEVKIPKQPKVELKAQLLVTNTSGQKLPIEYLGDNGKNYYLCLQVGKSEILSLSEGTKASLKKYVDANKITIKSVIAK